MTTADERSQMEDLRTQAQLVAFDPARAGTGSIGTVISRAEIADAAARKEFPATLLLDLDRVGTAAQARVAVDWDEPTLEKVLGSTEDNEIALWFDEGELARAFDERDVEGHGLRQRAAVLAIAVTAAGASAAPALATMEPGGGGGGGSGAQPAFTANPQAGAQPAGAVRGLQQDENIAVQQTRSGQAAAPAETSSGGGMSSGEIAAIAGAGAVLISAAGFGAARKRTPPVLPA
jgi:hypothetical protein